MGQGKADVWETNSVMLSQLPALHPSFALTILLLIVTFYHNQN